MRLQPLVTMGSHSRKRRTPFQAKPTTECGALADCGMIHRTRCSLPLQPSRDLCDQANNPRCYIGVGLRDLPSRDERDITVMLQQEKS